MFIYSAGMQAWEVHDPPPSRPIAAPLERCAELLGVDLATISEAAAHIQPYVRVDGTKVWSLMQLEQDYGARMAGVAGHPYAAAGAIVLSVGGADTERNNWIVRSGGNRGAGCSE
jgi:hypothetical protein